MITGHYWSIGGGLKRLIGSIKSRAYMPLSFIHNCQCCSLAAAKVLSDLLNQAFAVHLCEYSHGNSATIHTAYVHCHLQKWYTQYKFYVVSFCDIRILLS